jgi:uncharacterized alkaline shock family protein YloU
MDELVRDESLGIIKISYEVVSVIAGIAASEISGVYEFNSGVTSTIFPIGKKSAGKSVKVNVDGNDAVIDISILVAYGVRIPDVVNQVQENVKKTVEVMTGLKVSSVNINVNNIVIPKEEKVSKEK